MEIDNDEKLSMLPAEEDPVLFSAICRALALEKEPVDVLFLSDPATWLLDRGIVPTSRNMGVFFRISRKIFNITPEIRDRILEEERRIPSPREILGEAVKQFLEGRKG